MRAIIGMENGPIKIIDMEYSKVQDMLRVGPEDLDKNGTMTTEAIAWVVPNKSFVAAINGSIFFCNIETDTPVLTKVSSYSTGSSEECVYIGLYPGSQTDIITCTTLGDVVLHQGVCAEGTAIKIEPSSAKVICKAKAPAQAVCVGVRRIPIKKEESEENDEEGEKEVENSENKENGDDKKETKKTNKKKGEYTEEPIIAVGGKKNNVVVYSLVTGEKVWAVKKQKDDPRTHLPEPVWPTCVAFSKCRPNILVVGTGYNRVRSYNMAGVQRTAITDTLVTQRPLNCVTLFEKDKNPYNREFLAFGSTYGELMYVNPFGKKRVLGGFKGITGSVRSVCYNKEVLVVTGIDRFLRVFNFKSRLPIKKMYIKQIPKCMIITQEKWNPRSMDAQETDEIWNSLSDASAKKSDNAIVKNKEETKKEEPEDVEEEEEEEDDDDDDDHDDNVTDSESDESEEEEEEEVDDLTEGSSDEDDEFEEEDEEDEEEEEEIKAPIKKKSKKMN